MFDALNTVENHDKPGTNEGNSKLAEKGENSHVVSSAHGTSAEAFSTPNTTVDELVNADNDSEMDEVFNKTAGLMASTSS
ncbi:hypothetical protein Tco_0220504 [Tanacetum coccineum]